MKKLIYKGISKQWSISPNVKIVNIQTKPKKLLADKFGGAF